MSLIVGSLSASAGQSITAGQHRLLEYHSSLNECELFQVIERFELMECAQAVIKMLIPPLNPTPSLANTSLPIHLPFTHSLTPFIHSLTPFIYSLTPFIHSLTPFIYSLTPFIHSFTPLIHSLTHFKAVVEVVNELQQHQRVSKDPVLRNAAIHAVQSWKGL